MFETDRDSPRRTTEAIERLTELRKVALWLRLEGDDFDATLRDIVDKADELLSLFVVLDDVTQTDCFWNIADADTLSWISKWENDVQWIKRAVGEVE